VGGAGALPFGLSVPGGRVVPSSGVTVVGVRPTQHCGHGAPKVGVVRLLEHKYRVAG